ncbi:LAGLIDADG DNA endonuclease [Rhizoclosmatium globosum]|uniref:LAGLIDADG DNA endonuclease n=1 Tax=Rhizoclosmatium globosum TaxID=329046 RepID=A0A1Y1ZX56_9FUNG|nr:LAGLIDADG DNA endonuclease [Rhizoclosmatium globosum]|eukprot:ORY14355.1 LAGLIDADG DNA endonuclease [Rhizoclosmatium globosum]
MKRPDLSQFQKEAIVGNLLGDGHLQKGLNSKFPRLVFHRGGKDAPLIYAQHLKEIYGNITKQDIKVSLSKAGRYTSYFATRSLPALDYYYDLFYQNSKLKFVSPLLLNHVTPISLAYWIMDDGYMDRTSTGISTDGFTEAEVLFLSKLLADKFNLQNTVRTHTRTRGFDKLPYKGDKPLSWTIHIRVNSMDLLRSLVTPYMIPVMMYKITPK